MHPSTRFAANGWALRCFIWLLALMHDLNPGALQLTTTLTVNFAATALAPAGLVRCADSAQDLTLGGSRTAFSSKAEQRILGASAAFTERNGLTQFLLDRRFIVYKHPPTCS